MQTPKAMSFSTSQKPGAGDVMGTKKDRGRFTIKFNENDPAHEAVISILEQQGSRQKARFLVNAVLHYTQCSEVLNISKIPLQTIDKETVRIIVREILNEQQNRKPDKTGAEKKTELPQEFIEFAEKLPDQKTDDEDPSLDKDVIALIAKTMSDFRDF